MKTSDRTAWMTQREFDRMNEYSTSMPTGVVEGKRWKRKEESRWYMGEYHSLEDIGDNRIKYKIRWRRIVIMPPKHAHRVMDEDSLEFTRASGDCVCPDCGRTYRSHPKDNRFLGWRNKPYLRLICTGLLVKL